MVAKPITTIWNWWKSKQAKKNQAEIDRITNGWATTPSQENKTIDSEPMRYRLWVGFWRFVESTVPRDPKALYGDGGYQPRHAVKSTWTARETFSVNTQTGAWPVVTR